MKIVEAVIVDPNLQKNITKSVMDSWLVYYQRNAWIRTSTIKRESISTPMFFASVDDAVCFYENTDVDYILVNWFGTFCQDYHGYHEQCIRYIDEVNEHPWLLVGHIIDKEKQKKNPEFRGQFYPYPIAALLNLKVWREIGRPKWHRPEGRFHLPQASAECVHDDYTPVSLKTSNTFAEGKNLNDGALWISAALNNSLHVLNLPLALRKFLTHTYPESNPKEFSRIWSRFQELPLVDEPNLVKVLCKSLKSRTYTHTSTPSSLKLFVLNSEQIYPKGAREICLEALKETQVIVTPCSLFKSFFLSIEAPKLLRVIHYDIAEASLRAKRYLNENWDGSLQSLEGLLRELLAESWNPEHLDVFASLKAQMLLYCGSEQSLRNCWQMYVGTQHSYLSSNLMFDDQRLVGEVAKTKDQIIYTCIGDIPSFRLNSINYGAHNLAEMVIQHLERLEAVSSTVYVDIKMPVSDRQIFMDSTQLKTLLKKEVADFSFEVTSAPGAISCE
jgi:hypothetical protein